MSPRTVGLVFGALLLWFTCLNQWGTFPDPDAYYHAHLAVRVLEHGAVQSFPWLDLTTLGQHPIDQHYLYHRVLGPAIALFGAFPGIQIMAVLLGTLAMTAFWVLLRSLSSSGSGAIPAFVLTGATLLVPFFTLRMLSPKASSIAITCFLVTIGAMLFRRPMLAALAGFVFALAHGGWILSLATAALMLAGDALVSRAVRGEPWSASVRSAPWKPLGFLLLGIAAGLVLHPNRTEILPFLWVQIVEVGIRRQRTIPIGSEWRPPRLLSLGQTLLPLGIALIAWMFTFVWARARGRLHRPAPEAGGGRDDPIRASLVLTLPALLTLILTLRSRRFLEYLVPAFAIWITSLWALLDLDVLAARIRVGRLALVGARRATIAIGFGAVSVALVALQTYAVWGLLSSFRYPWDVYRTTMGAISERARPNDRVFNAGWDDFPILFALDDRLRYVWGLDPTFLYDASPVLAGQVAGLVFGRRADAWEVIRTGTDARFVFVRTTKFQAFDALLRGDPRFREIARDPWSAAYEVVDASRE